MRPRLRLDSLRTRIILWSFIPTAAILFAVALVTYYSYARVTEDLVVQRNRELARLSAGQLANELGSYVDLLEGVARTADFYQGVVIVQQAALRRLSSQLAVFDGGVAALDQRGRVVAVSPGTRVDLAEDWSGRRLFRDVVTEREPTFSDVLLPSGGGPATVAVAVPILGEGGEFRGVLAGLFELGATTVSTFYGDIVRLRVGETGEAFLVDSNGWILYSGNSAPVASDRSGDPVVADVLAGKVGAVRTKDPTGADVVASYAPVPGTGWGLVSVESWQALAASSRSYQRFLLLLLVIGLVVPTVLVTVGVRRITRPLAGLTQAASEMAEGRFEQAELRPTFAELGDLVTQFNHMSARLAESYEDLEQRVADRTRELATLNAIAAVASGSLDLERVLGDSLAKAVEAMGMDGGAAFSLDEQENAYTLVARQGVSTELAACLDGRSPGEWVGWFGAGEGPGERRPSSFPEGRLGTCLLEEPAGSVVSVPLTAKGRAVGTILLVTREPRQISPEELELLASIGNQVGVAVDNVRLYRRAEETAAAAERSRLARDLHDAVSQTLFSASLIAEVLPRIWERDREEAGRRFDELRALTRGALAEMRTLLLELRPTALEEAELGEVIRQLGEAVTGRARIPVRVEVSGTVEAPAEVRVSLYRIAQEALNNVVKHASATEVVVELTASDEGVRLRIADDGKGFDPTQVTSDHLGLGIMAERAHALGAVLSVTSSDGAGTEVVVDWSASATT